MDAEKAKNVLSNLIDSDTSLSLNNDNNFSKTLNNAKNKKISKNQSKSNILDVS